MVSQAVALNILDAEKEAVSTVVEEAEATVKIQVGSELAHLPVSEAVVEKY